MFELHVSWLGSVLHVAHNIELSAVRLLWALLNACELCSRSEKGRHELSASEFVRFMKKFWQPTVEKFACIDVSKG